MALTRAQILARKSGHEEVPIGDGVVVVRGMTRAEGHASRRIDSDEEREIWGVARCLVDPQMSEDDVREWFAAAPSGEVQPIVERILQLSGMMDGQAKEATKSVRRGRSGAHR